MFLINKRKLLFRKKMSSESENLKALVLITEEDQKKKKNQKGQNHLIEIMTKKQERQKRIC